MQDLSVGHLVFPADFVGCGGGFAGGNYLASALACYRLSMPRSRIGGC